MLPLHQADYSQGVGKGLNKTTREHPDKLRCAPQQAPADSCERGALEPLSSGELSLMLLYYSITLDQMQKGSQRIHMLTGLIFMPFCTLCLERVFCAVCGHHVHHY